MMTCPCCGSAIDKPSLPVECLADIRLTPKQRKILGIVLDAYPRPVSTGLLVDAIYGADPDGGPLTVRNVLAVHISRVRVALEPYGWTIPISRKGSGNTGLYRLEKKQESER